MSEKTCPKFDMAALDSNLCSHRRESEVLADALLSIMWHNLIHFHSSSLLVPGYYCNVA